MTDGELKHRLAAAEVRRISPDFSLEKYAATQPYKNTTTLKQIIRGLQQAGLKWCTLRKNPTKGFAYRPEIDPGI